MAAKTRDPFALQTLKEMRAKLAERPEAAKVFRDELQKRWAGIPAEQKAFVCKMAKCDGAAGKVYADLTKEERTAIRAAVWRLRKAVEAFEAVFKQV